MRASRVQRVSRDEGGAISELSHQPTTTPMNESEHLMQQRRSAFHNKREEGSLTFSSSVDGG